MDKMEKGELIFKLLRIKTFNGCYFDMNKYYIPKLFLDDIMNYRFEELSHTFLDNAISELSKLPNMKQYDGEFLVKINGIYVSEWS